MKQINFSKTKNPKNKNLCNRYLDERAEAARRRAERVSASPPRDAASVEDGQEGGEEGEESIDVEKGEVDSWRGGLGW